MGGLWSPCQSVFYTQSWLPDSTWLTCWLPLPTTYAPNIISFLVFWFVCFCIVCLFVCLFCWQLLGPNSNLQLFMQLKPYCQHPYPQYTTIPGVWAELFRCHHEKGREMGWGSQKQGFLGSSAKAHIVAELLFLLLTSIWGGFSFGIINRSQLAVCLLLSGQTQHSGRGKYHGIFLAI